MHLSVIIPVFNEEANIPPLHAELHGVMERTGRAYEILFIDDGSTDGSFSVLKEVAHANPATRVIRFRRRFGQTAALSAGIDHARGEIIITMDADLQNDPADIPALLAKLEQGFDIVSGWRVRRKDPFLNRRLPSILANRLISKLSGIRLHDYGCTLKAYKAGVLKSIRLYGEMHRFIPALASWLGVEVAEVQVNHRPRIHGKSKYDLTRVVRVVLDLINVKFLLTYSTRPIQVFGFFGVGAFGLALVGLIITALLRLRGVDITGNPLFLISIMLLLMGMQFVTMGLLGEISIRTYHETQDKRIYVIRETVNSPGGEA
ncbi:glycosyltransferase family 2 protein [Candidatus Fermentibacteria bacterium]|nr:glycosyltransferase family 2 protein [Candidatus Fermentibacteria bacterium]